MFDFDPDEMADEVEEEAEAVAEEEIEEAEVDPDEGFEEESEEDDHLAEVAVGAAIFGMAEEHGADEAERKDLKKKGMKAKIEGERPEGAISLKDKKKKKNSDPFEQWVDDVIEGRKTLDDEL